MKPALSTSVCASVAVSFLLLAPPYAVAQHTAGGAPSVGSAVPAGGSSGGSGSSSSGDSGSGGQTGGGESFGRPAMAGHRATSGSGVSSAGFAGGNNQVFTNYSQLSSPAPMFSRPRNGRPIVGTAIPRGSAPAPDGGGVLFIEGTFNPWLYAYDGFAGMPFFGVYDPFALDFGYPIAGGSSTTYTSSTSERGVLRLDVKPRNAEVFVDGGRAGKADEFVGLFHKLRLEAGVHRLELRAPGYEPLVVNVRIQAGESMTYRGTLEKTAP